MACLVRVERLAETMRACVAREKRVLGIDPCSTGFGFALLEIPDRLIDWGVKTATSNAECLARIAALIDFYRPQIVAIEDVSAKGSRRRDRVSQLLNEIPPLAIEKKVRVRLVSRARLRKSVVRFDGPTKYQIAVLIAERFPELRPHLPPKRKLWMSEDSRIRIFGAVSLISNFAVS